MPIFMILSISIVHKEGASLIIFLDLRLQAMEQLAQLRDGKRFFLDWETNDSVVYCLILFSNTTNYIAGMSWK